jgi:general secretion pathway protein G
MLERIREARRNESGFTLIELLIVIVILGVLAGIVVFAVSGVNDTSKTSACQTDVKTVTSAAEAYYAQNKTYATHIDDIVAGGFLHSNPNGTGASNDTGPIVNYVANNTSTPKKVTVTGATGSDCVGFSG